MFDPHKPARTRDGRPATLYRIDSTTRQPYTFRIPANHASRGVFQVTVGLDGKFYEQGGCCHLDLENYTPEPAPATKPPTFDPNKPVQRRDGAKARILCTDRRGEQPLECDYPIVALVEASNGTEVTTTYTATGGKWKCPPENYDGAYDLVNTPVERTAWLISYVNSLGTTEVDVAWDEDWARRQIAKHGSRALACFPVTFKEGQGLTPPDPK